MSLWFSICPLILSMRGQSVATLAYHLLEYLLLLFSLIYFFLIPGEGNDVAAEWFIENVQEELDSANEFFFDEANHQLQFVYVPRSALSCLFYHIHAY